jgi:radial spoke head protein 9
MELMDLEYGLKSVATGGNVLSQQEIMCVHAGLNSLKMQQKISEVFLWGKILGTQQDYYIAYGIGSPEFEFPSKVYFYATEDFQFQAMPQITEEVADRIIDLAVDAPFAGDPNKIIEPSRESENAAETDATASDKPPKLTEADRLAQVVQEIDFDTAVVPKGAYALNEAHVVVPSGDFKGLSMAEASSIQKYVHYRPPTSVASLRAQAGSDMHFFSNFLDPLESDLPKGCWSIRQDPACSFVNIRSLLWPGYIAFHVPTTTKHGGLYFGYGQKNRDLPFIL